MLSAIVEPRPVPVGEIGIFVLEVRRAQSMGCDDYNIGIARCNRCQLDDFEQSKNVTSLPPGLASFTWSTKVHELLPGDAEWKLADPYASEHTNIRDMLSYLSGIAAYVMFAAPRVQICS